MMAQMISIFVWITIVLMTVIIPLVSLPLVPLSWIFDSRKGRIHRMAALWGRTIMGLVPGWRIQVSGQENLEPGRHYVIVANHQSMLDILVSLAALPHHFKFLAKKELFAIPFLGWHMFFAGYIPVDRRSAMSGRKAMYAARRWLKAGVSVLFFPEGTRSLDGRIHDFKAGAFRLAEAEGIPVLPLVMDGTGEAMPKKSWLISHIHPMKLSIGKPVRIASGDSLDEKVAGIRNEMIGRLEKLRHTTSGV